MSNIKAAIITIGDELLIGQTIDTNSAWIAQQLNQMGIDVTRRVAVGDERAAIINTLDQEIRNASLVIVTGGLGPTSDDITKPLLCEYFKGSLVVNEEVLQHLKEIFVKRNRPFLERNLKQAEVPDNCKVLFNKMGTAPGMWFEKDGKVIISLPGVPFEMVHIMQEEALPLLSQRFISDALLHYPVITAGEGESFIAEKIADIENALPPYIKLAYLPGAGIVKLRLTGRGGNKQLLADEMAQFQKQLAERLGDIVIALEDVPLEYLIGKNLLDKGATLGLAESCTGGFIAHQITNVAGSSGYFKGDVVCYQDEVKYNLLGIQMDTLNQYGAISEQVAIEMSAGARERLRVDYAFSITGLLGPYNEKDKEEVGVVWMAVADKERTVSKRFRFYYDRPRNKEMAVQMGLLMIWKFINGKL